MGGGDWLAYRLTQPRLVGALSFRRRSLLLEGARAQAGIDDQLVGMGRSGGNGFFVNLRVVLDRNIP